MHPSAFLGREEDLAACWTTVGSALDRDGCLLLVSGEAGVGKTRLCEVLAGHARERDAAVLWASCWQDPAPPSFWPWTQILRACARGRGRSTFEDDLGEARADLSLLLPELSDGEPVPETGEPNQLRFRLFDSVVNLLGHISTHQPLLIVLDDLHWADAPSLRLLQFASNELRAEPIAIVGSYRYPDLDPNSELANALPDLRRSGRSHRLEGLGADDVRRLLSTAAGTQAGDRLSTLVQHRTSGNPLFVQEIGQFLSHQGTVDIDAATTALPDSVRSVMMNRLAFLSDRCIDVLQNAAVLGQRFSLPVLQRVTREAPESLSQLINEAQRANVVAAAPEGRGACDFTHALVRDVLYENIPPSERPPLHRLAGESIEELGTQADEGLHVDELARHFDLARSEDTSDKALRYTLAASEHALRMLAYEDAVRYLERALEMSDQSNGGAETRLEILLSLGAARTKAGDWPGAVDAYDNAAALARTSGNADGLARAALGLGAGLGFEVRLFDDKQIELLNEALATQDDSDSSLRAWLLARLSVALSFIEGEERRRQLSLEAIEVARRVKDPAALAYALAAHCDAIAGPSFVEERLAHSSEVVSLSRAMHDPQMELLGRRLRLVAYLEQGDAAAVDDEIDAYERTAEKLRQSLYLWCVPLWRAMRELMRGRLAHCAELQESAHELGSRAQSTNAEILVNAQRINLLQEQGRPKEACELCEQYFRPSQFPSSAAWLAGLLPAADRGVEAHGILDRIADGSLVVPSDAEWVAALCMAAEGCGAVGHAAAAERIYNALLPYSAMFAVDGIGAACLGSVAAYLGTLAGVLGRPDEGDAHFALALENNRRAGGSLLVAHTLRRRAEMHIRSEESHRDTFEPALHEALQIYKDLDVRYWIEITAKMLDSAGSTPAPTAVERNVFRKEGDYWILVFNGVETRVKDAKGLHDMAHLLARPNQEVHALDLVGSITSDHPRQAVESDAGDVLDEAARSAYKHRLAELEEEMAEAETNGDAMRFERARDERDAIASELASSYGLGGRARKLGDRSDRARATVTWRIRAALARIEKSHPMLGRHLRNSIKTGTFCSYAPEGDMQWSLQ